jgi:hypothetical protein
MNKLYTLEPEVAGEIGEQSRIKYKDGMISVVMFLHYEFTGWLGDELLTSSPCFIVAKSLADDISLSQLSGYKLEKILQSKSDEFEELYPGVQLPEFVRIVPEGTVQTEDGIVKQWSGQDFCLEDEVDLVVTRRALEIISKHRITNCNINELNI